MQRALSRATTEAVVDACLVDFSSMNHASGFIGWPSRQLNAAATGLLPASESHAEDRGRYGGTTV
jgi:hypothetical protein